MDKVKLVPLSELVVSINSGLNPRNNFILNEEGAECIYLNIKHLPFINDIEHIKNIENVPSFDKISKETKKLINKKSKLENGDILVPAIFIDVKHITMIKQGAEQIDISENIYVIKANEKINKDFLLYALKTNFVQKQFEEKAVGKVLRRITKKALNDILIPLPPIEIQNQFAETLNVLSITDMLALMVTLKPKHLQTKINDLILTDNGLEEFQKIQEHLNNRLNEINKQLNTINNELMELSVCKYELIYKMMKLKEKQKNGKEGN